MAQSYAAFEWDAAGPEKQSGVVTQWNGSFGFIEFTDGRRAYVHNSACGGVPLIEGQAVVAQVVPDPRNPGKWQAQAVERVAAYTDDSTGRLQGVVAQWHSTYGFVHFSDGRRAYVHQSDAGGQALAEGQQVVGLLVEDPQNPGKWQAQSVERVVSAVTDGSGRLHGQVTQWQGNYGFIQFSDGRRAYVHSSQTGGVPLTEGEPVFGHVAEDPKNPGKWQAFEVAQAGGAIPGATPSAAHLPPPPPAPVAVQAQAAPGGANASWAQTVPNAPSNDGRIQAQVTQWSGTYGFVQLEDGRRAYVHNSQCGGAVLQEGELVFCRITEDPRNPGKWQAVEVQRGHAAAVFRRAVVGAAPPPQPAAAAAWREPVAAPAAQRIWGPGPEQAGTLQGTVVQWMDRGYGFIDLVDGRRAYVHNSACGGEHLAVGEVVTAVVVADGQNPGKWQAQRVQRGAGQSSQELGTVSEWKVQGGYGFVHLDDARRAYIHRSALPGGVGDLEVGMRLSVAIKEDARNAGKWCVDRVIGTAPAPVSVQVPSLSASPPHSFKCSGVVSDWNPRGFGFALFEDGRRAYVHNSQCGGEHLQQGEVIAADVVPDDRTPGKFQAQNIERTGTFADPSSFVSEPAAKRARLV